MLPHAQLEGPHVRLDPLSESHHSALCEVGLDPSLWEWTPFRVTSPDEMMTYIQDALKAKAAGTALPYVTVDRASGRVVGSTRFMSIDEPNRHVEIGSTWISAPYQRTPVNTEAKYLMLRQAFETFGCLRVELKTDSLNRRSRDAIRRIGATEEGIFRNHMITWSGRMRHSVWFSIIDTEWLHVKANLEAKLAARPDTRLRRVDMLAGRQIADLHRLFQNEWWSKGRTLEETRHMLDATKILVGLTEPANGQLVAFARATTDDTFKAVIFDVIVDHEYRSRDVGRELIDALLAHPALKSVRHLELYCRPELVPFYEKWGFAEVPEVRFMRRA